jgi:hypothetical protein
VLFEKPFIDAWQCYPEGTSVYDLKYGVCPAFLGRQISPICDQPGIRCGRETTRYSSEFHTAMSLTQLLLSVSFAIYIASVTPKVQYWKTIFDKAVVDATKKTQ